MPQETKKVSWNASQGLIIEISRRRSEANSYFIFGKIARAINTLISIKQSVIQSLKKEEREDLDRIEKKFSKIKASLNPLFANSFNNKHKEIYRMGKTVGENIYSEYNNLLMDLLEDRGYLIDEKTDASKMSF